ncbi:hypothetical protein HHK36_015731 [Tetracentron sinense]|uniref:Uncharacterized protein n=1 Tax=Tetracentron sinense TaxID=13715 RepID=A0A834Z3L7_TETSI|nr:hypothetical protein HHK36_015731 [Tetracentron sinense]
MEPPKGVWASLWSFICFFPFFIGLLLLGMIKGRATYLGPVLKLVLCVCISVLLILWPLVAIVGSILAGAGYGLLAPLVATFEAVGEGKTDEFIHCIFVRHDYSKIKDGTWSTVKGSFTVVRDFTDVCYHSYFSAMDDLRLQGPSNGKSYEIRLLHLPGAILAGVLGFMVDMPVITLIALCKSPYMLFKGWHRLFHDLIGREGPFLETICVPFAGLAILLWPLAVIGAVLGSVVSSIFLGAYASVIAYQESSVRLGLCYIISSLSIYDEYSNDVLDMPEGSCFPRLRYRKQRPLSRTTSFSKPDSFRIPPSPSRSSSPKNPMIELKPLEKLKLWYFDYMQLLNRLFEECQHHGEIMVAEGQIRLKDIEDSKSSTGGNRVISIGLPAYCILRALLRSIMASSEGILLSDNATEITTTNRPKDAFFDWFFNPLLIIKDQIKAENLSEAEENHLCKLVLLGGDPERLKNSNLGSPPECEHKRAELDALARRLQGITKSISRYPTFRRRFDSLVKTLSEELAKKNGGCTKELPSTPRSKSGLVQIFSQKSFKSKTSNHGSDKENEPVVRDLEIA